MRTQSLIQVRTVLAVTLAALGTSLACGGSQPEANTPTNEGAPPSTDSNTAPSGDTNGTDTSGSSGMGGAGGAAPSNDTTTPPEGYAGSSNH